MEKTGNKLGRGILKMNAQASGIWNTVRTSLIRALGTSAEGQVDPNRDIAAACGYPIAITVEQYKQAYSREGIASRVVSVYPEESWQKDPEIKENEEQTETPWEAAWGDFVERFNIYYYLHRIDELSGVGAFGILLFGLDDGKELKEPVDGIDLKTGKGTGKNEYNLLYLRPFDQSVVKIASYEKDPKSPRYGMPLMYSIEYAEIRDDSAPTSEHTITTKIHWTRVLHVADNRKDSEVYGTPRMQIVFNRLYDLQKVLAGSGEMFWKGAFPGFSLEVNPDVADNVTVDREALRAETEAYFQGLDRVMALQGMTVKSLSPQVSDPSAHVETQLKAIAISLKIPWRIFLGTEEAKLAGSQDVKAWNGRLKHRQDKYVIPMLIRPFMDKCIAFGMIEESEEVSIKFPDLEVKSDIDKASVADKTASALSKYVSSGAYTLIAPDQFFIQVLGYDQATVDAIMKTAETFVDDSMDEKAIAEEKARDTAPLTEGK